MDITISYCDDINKNYTDCEQEDTFTLLRAASDALQDGDLQAFQRNIQKIDMSGYMDPGLGKEFLIPAFIIFWIMEHDVDNSTEYMQAVLDQRPNLDLPYIKGNSFGFIDFLIQYRTVMNCILSNNLENLEVELNKMRLLLESDEEVLYLFDNDRDDLETQLQKIDLVLDQVRHCKS